MVLSVADVFPHVLGQVPRPPFERVSGLLRVLRLLGRCDRNGDPDYKRADPGDLFIRGK